MSETKFKEAKGQLAFSQSLVDKIRQPQQMAQQSPEMSQNTPMSAPTTPTQPSPFDTLQLPETPVAPKQSLGSKVLDFFGGKVTADNEPVEQSIETPPTDVRGVQATPDEVQRLKHAIYSEVSNRLSPVEVTAMVNVAFNKAKQEGKPLSAVVDDPNFFQGITNKRYGTTSPVGADKNVSDFVGNTVDTYLSGDKTDHTNGATHFVHITSGKGKDKLVTMTEKEFDTYLSKKGAERDTFAEDLIN